MKIEIYCDEAHPDLFSSQNPQAWYMIIGSLWLRVVDRSVYKNAIHKLRDQYKIGGEFKWRKVSPSRIEFYKALIEWFCELGENLRFRCIAIKGSILEVTSGTHGLDQNGIAGFKRGFICRVGSKAQAE